MKNEEKIFKNKLVPCTGWYGVVKDKDGRLKRGASVIAFSVSYVVDPVDHGSISNELADPIFQLLGRCHDDFGLMRPDGRIEYVDGQIFQDLGHLQQYVDEEDASSKAAIAAIDADSEPSPRGGMMVGQIVGEAIVSTNKGPTLL